MSAKKLHVKGATIKIPSGYIGYFGKFVPGALKTSMLPIPVLIVDADDQLEYECEHSLILLDAEFQLLNLIYHLHK